jgi:ABC-type transport system involved in multi-copper enzyme maturation permease subunit
VNAAPHTRPRIVSRHKPPAPVRTNTVFMGQMDFASTLLRLISVELYKLRRRTMSTVLWMLCIGAIVATFGIIALVSALILHSSPGAFLPPLCSQAQSATQSCLKHAPTAADMTQAVQARAATVANISQPLRLPQSLSLATAVTQNVGLLLIIILAGTIVGGEYSHGTVRLILTRGPTRTQFILMKIGAIVICIIVGFLAMIFSGILLGTILNPITGTPQTFYFLTAAWIGHALLYLLIGMFGLFTYAMLALFLATVGRATAAGVAGALAWVLLEPVLSGILSLIGSLNRDLLGDILKAIPDYLISNNIAALLQNQERYLFNTQPATLSNLHALCVLVAYLVIFMSIAWLITVRRDVTN